MIIKIDEKGRYLELFPDTEIPLIEVDGELVPDKTFVFEPIPNDIYFSEEHPAKWTGTEWVATAEPPEPTPNPPSDIEKLEAKITAAGAYTDFLEEVIVEIAQAVFQ